MIPSVILRIVETIEEESPGSRANSAFSASSMTNTECFLCNKAGKNDGSAIKSTKLVGT